MDATLHQLRCFLAVAESLHFSRAAEAMRISPSTLSEQVSTLERVLGRRLFERSSRAVSLTRQGEELVVLAQSVTNASDAIARWSRGVGESVLSIGVTASSAGFRAILSSATERMPEVRWQIRPVGFTGGLPAVRARDVDCAFVYGLPFDTAPSGLHLTELWSEELIVALPERHRLAGRSSIAVQDLWGEVLIAASGGESESGGPWDDWYGAIDQSLPRECTISPLVSSVDETMELVAAGMGLNIAGASAVTSYARPGLSYVLLDTPKRVLALLVVRDEPADPVLGRFVEIARHQHSVLPNLDSESADRFRR